MANFSPNQPRIEHLEARLQFSAIQYGVAASDDPAVTGVLATSGPGLKDLGAKAVRLFTDTSFLSSDFGVTPSGKVYVEKPALVTVLQYAKEYHDAGIDVTLCIQLDMDHSMLDGSPLTDPTTGASRNLLPSELRSPTVFKTWYRTFAEAQISKSDSTSVTKVLDFWEIGNETNHGDGAYWPVDLSETPDQRIDDEINSYVDHDLIPAYDVLHALGEPVIGAGFASGTVQQFDELNNQPGARKHQYSNHVDYLNFHPYSYFDSPLTYLTPQVEVDNFMNAIYGDGTVKKPFVITEYNLSDFNHEYSLDPDPNPSEAAEQQGVANDLDEAHTQLLNTKHVQLRCAWIYYYRLVAEDTKTRGALFYPPPDGSSPYVPMPALYDMFKGWAKGVATATTPKTSGGAVNLGGTSVINSIATEKNGDTLVLTDDGVRRYDSKGTLDTTYGDDGFAALPLIGKALALESDGGLIVGGSTADLTTDSTPYHMVVTRLTPSGAIDTTFATDGYFTMKSGTGSKAISIALRAGKIVIGGQKAGVDSGVIIRMNVDGSLDSTFADGGAYVLQNQGFFNDLSIAKSGAITALLIPYTLSPQSAIARFTNTGSLDAHFGTGGISAVQPIVADGMFVNGSGSVDLVGHDALSASQVIEHYTARGNLDTSFADGGTQTLSVKNEFLRGIPVEGSDGTRYLVGSIGSDLTSDDKHIFIARLTADDQLDLTFDSKGVRTFSSTNVQDVPFAVAINSDNAITAAAGAFTHSDGQDMSQELFVV